MTEPGVYTPGPKADLMIAEKILGWVKGKMYGNMNGEWLDHDGRVIGLWDNTPRFSTHWDAASQIIRHLLDEGYHVTLGRQHERWTCELARLNDPGSDYETATTLPWAICLAACLVKGV